MDTPQGRELPSDPHYSSNRDPEFDDKGSTGSHLLDYVRAVYRRRWLVLTTFVLVLVVSGVRTFTTTPVYEATAQLLIDTGERKVLTFDEVIQQDRTAADYSQTQYRLLQSRALARQTLDALKLWDRPPFGGAPSTSSSISLRAMLSAPLRWVADRSRPEITPTQPTVPDETRAQSVAIDRFLQGLSISPIRNSQLVDLKYRSPDPRFAATAANAVARQYIVQMQQQRLDVSEEATGFLGQQLEQQRKALQTSELALQKYRERNDGVSLEDRQNIVVQKLADLNAAVTKAKMVRIQKEGDYQQLQQMQTSREALDTFPAILANTYIQELKSDLATLEGERVQLSERLGDKHPSMVKMAAAIQAAEAKLGIEIQKVVQSVRNEFLAAQVEEESLTAALNGQKNDALAQNRKAISYGALQRDVATNRELFEALLQRAKETGISGELKASNVRIVDAAEVPSVPVLPSHVRNLAMGAMAGLVLAIGFAFFLDYLDNRIKSPEEIAAHLRMPCLGLVPLIAHQANDDPPMINNGVPADFAEAFKGLRTNVMFSHAEDGSRSVVVTSTGTGEGKTTVSANLAMALSQSGQRVLLIDADMRRPSAHELMNQTLEPGLSNLIVGNAKASDAVRPAGIPGLWMLPAGRVPPNPAELLSSVRFKEFLQTLRSHFDWIILDSPPVMAVTDASVLAHVADSVVFVVGAEMANRAAAKTAVHQLEAANGKLMGAVLNRVNLKRHGYYYSTYYRREYSQYYTAAS